jgi:hypothetical protein
MVIVRFTDGWDYEIQDIDHQWWKWWFDPAENPKLITAACYADETPVEPELLAKMNADYVFKKNVLDVFIHD